MNMLHLLLSFPGNPGPCTLQLPLHCLSFSLLLLFSKQDTQDSPIRFPSMHSSGFSLNFYCRFHPLQYLAQFPHCVLFSMDTVGACGIVHRLLTRVSGLILCL